MIKHLTLPNNSTSQYYAIINTYNFEELHVGDTKCSFLDNGTTIVRELTFDGDDNPVWTPQTATPRSMAIIANRAAITSHLVFNEETDVYIRLLDQNL